MQDTTKVRKLIATCMTLTRDWELESNDMPESEVAVDEAVNDQDNVICQPNPLDIHLVRVLWSFLYTMASNLLVYTIVIRFHDL